MEITFIIIPTFDIIDAQPKINEITNLAISAGAEVKSSLVVKINKITPATFIGKGKIEQIKNICEELECNLVLFDGELSPSQTLNLSDALGGIKVIDRTTLILDIFAQRARSSEGKIQVELAQLKHIYPRLKGKGSALSRLGGGIGTRGPGETKLETDRRHIKKRMLYLENRLEELEKRRALQGERRTKNGALKVALVGYTNTGKSTLLNALTQSEVLAEDKLFATLDPTTRKLNLMDFSVLLTDTVGFLKDIPTSLIEAFKSTLESAVESDLILIVCDALTDWCAQLDTTTAMLDELKANAPRLIIFNKCENISDFSAFPSDAIFISAKEQKGLDLLQLKIKEFFENLYMKLNLRISYDKTKDFFSLEKYFERSKIEYTDSGINAEIVINRNCLPKFDKFK
ncbi:MAG: GTPase HflX [Clostridia bacterium]|nr:GTPase HflX [Clostridia bacterium]